MLTQEARAASSLRRHTRPAKPAKDAQTVSDLNDSAVWLVLAIEERMNEAVELMKPDSVVFVSDCVAWLKAQVRTLELIDEAITRAGS